MSNALRAYSLGYEGLSLDRYVEVLKSHAISVVVDVRETPWSYKPGFSKKPLSERLDAEGISYIHLKSAGNPSRNRKLGLPQQAVIELYKRHLDADPSCLSQILDLIESTSQRGAVCLLCFEQKPHECHRKVILDRLSERKQALMTCHLHGRATTSKEPITSKRIPKSNNRKGARVHMEIAQDEGRPIDVRIK
jgi:uncharacterized protein (DUF488 family)